MPAGPGYSIATVPIILKSFEIILYKIMNNNLSVQISWVFAKIKDQVIHMLIFYQLSSLAYAHLWHTPHEIISIINDKNMSRYKVQSNDFTSPSLKSL